MSDFKARFEKILGECMMGEYSHLAPSFEKLAEMLVSTNEKYNLTAITDTDGIILRHFADSLTAEKYIPKNSKVIDVGTGGGFPSLVLAIARPDVQITALDSTAKKLEFIKEAAKELSLTNITTLAARAEDIGNSALRESFDVSVSRAVARLSILSELCIPLTKAGGLFIAMKGADAKAELSEGLTGIKMLGASVESTNFFELSSAGERCIIVCKKENRTDKKYPRAYAKIKKSPLGI